VTERRSLEWWIAIVRLLAIPFAVLQVWLTNGYPPGYAALVAANVVSREDNVAAVVAKVGLGEGDAGIVYGTDAQASSRVKRIPIPAAVKVSVTYAAVVVKSSRQPEAARAFLSFLASSPGQAILARYGFVTP